MKSIVEAIFLFHFYVYLCNITEIAGVITLAREVHTGMQDIRTLTLTSLGLMDFYEHENRYNWNYESAPLLTYIGKSIQ
jgi:hypothetical protein